MRSVLSVCVLAAACAVSSPADAQSFGVGGRLSVVRGDVAAGTLAERFTGGHLRAAVSRRASIELALDRKSELNETLTERTRESPFQASLLLYPARGPLAPYVLGGVGWYTTRIEQLDGTTVLDAESSRRMGYHGGFGAELRLGRRAGLHGDYRYTFLRFRTEEDDEAGAASMSLPGLSGSRFLPTYEGSMWTFGLTVYF